MTEIFGVKRSPSTARPFNLALDFDGTLVTHDYPEVGRDIGAAAFIKQLLEDFKGYPIRLILFTMRSSKQLHEAENWCMANGLELWAANCNPEQHTWTKSPKVYAHAYIDDAAVGTPMIYPVQGRPYVNWSSMDLYIDIRNRIKAHFGITEENFKQEPEA